MTYSQFYLPANIPQWGIFLGVVFVIVGYIEKKETWALAGWLVLITTGLTSLGFNLFGGLVYNPEEQLTSSSTSTLITCGWMSVAGGCLAAVSLFFQMTKKKSYRILAILTVIYFMLIFFQFNALTRSQTGLKKSQGQTEQSN